MGFANPLDVHLRRATSESKNQEVSVFFNKLYSILKLDPLRKGKFTPLDCQGSSTILSWKWVFENDHILVCVHFGELYDSGSIVLNDVPKTNSTIPLRDLIAGTIYERNSDDLRTKGLYVVLDQYQVQVFRY